MINNLLIASLYIPEISDCIKIYQRTELLTFVLVHNTGIYYLLLQLSAWQQKEKIFYLKKKNS